MLFSFFYRKLQLVMNRVIWSSGWKQDCLIEDPTTTAVIFSSQLSDGSNSTVLWGCENLGAKIWGARSLLMGMSRWLWTVKTWISIFSSGASTCAWFVFCKEKLLHEIAHDAIGNNLSKLSIIWEKNNTRFLLVGLACDCWVLEICCQLSSTMQENFCFYWR